MDKDAPVHIVVTEAVYENSKTGEFAARYREVGMTAYGPTAEAAIANLKASLDQAIRRARERGVLEKWLDHIGVKWHWAHDEPSPLSHMYLSREENWTPRQERRRQYASV